MMRIETRVGALTARTMSVVMLLLTLVTIFLPFELGAILLDIFIPVAELFLPIIPGDVFPYFFGETINGEPVEMFQRSLFATFLITSIACFLGPYLMIRNLSLIGDGLAHVAFGGICVGLVIGATQPLNYAVVFAVTASILIYELQSLSLIHI